MIPSISDNPFAPPEKSGVALASGNVEFADLHTAGVGLRLIFLSLLLLGLLHLLAMIGVGLPDNGSQQSTWPSSSVLYGPGFFLSGLLALMGTIMCSTVPIDSDARSPIVIAIIFQLVYLLISVTRVAWGGSISNSAWLWVSCSLLNGVSVFLFVVSLRRLSLFVFRNDLAKRAGWLMLIMPIGFAAGFAHYLFATQAPMLSFFAGLVVIIATWGTFVTYASLVNALAKQIRNPSTAPASGHLG